MHTTALISAMHRSTSISVSMTCLHRQESMHYYVDGRHSWCQPRSSMLEALAPKRRKASQKRRSCSISETTLYPD
jgi:hypothetical protein